METLIDEIIAREQRRKTQESVLREIQDYANKVIMNALRENESPEDITFYFGHDQVHALGSIAPYALEPRYTQSRNQDVRYMGIRLVEVMENNWMDASIRRKQ